MTMSPTHKPTLYDLERDYLEREEMLIALFADSEISEADKDEAVARAIDLTDVAEQKVMAKVDATRGFVNSMLARHDLYVAEAARLTAHARALRGIVERVKGYVKSVMVATGAKRLSGRLGWINLQASNAALVIEDDSAIPPSYWDQVLILNRERVRDALKAGVEVPGARLERGQHVRFYPSAKKDELERSEAE
jgi:hypothetical protein